MARYNVWQNNGLREVVAEINIADLNKDRGGFFGSIMGTLNHLLWGDIRWMSRFDGGAGTDLPIAQSATLTATSAIWAADRVQMDARISLWAQNVDADRLNSDLHWQPVGSADPMTMPMGLCATHLFNHQTHHRGQIHAMLTEAGHTLRPTDLPFMPEDI